MVTSVAFVLVAMSVSLLVVDDALQPHRYPNGVKHGHFLLKGQLSGNNKIKSPDAAVVCIHIGSCLRPCYWGNPLIDVQSFFLEV